jgi:hypothetical protein
MDITPAISAVEMQRQAQIRARIKHNNHTHQINQLRRKVYCGLRRAAIFILGAAIVTVVLANRDEIARVTAQKMRMIASHVQKEDESSLLRKNALTHEKEVDEVVGK